MKEPLSVTADRLGLTFESLSIDARDRLIDLQHLDPEWDRGQRVQYVISGCVNGKPLLPDADAATVLRFFGREISMEHPQDQFDDVRCRKIARQLALDGAVLLPRHKQIIIELASLARSSMFRPLRDVPRDNMPRVRELVAKLPRTRAIQEWLAVTSDGQPENAARF